MNGWFDQAKPESSLWSHVSGTMLAKAQLVTERGMSSSDVIESP